MATGGVSFIEGRTESAFLYTIRRRVRVREVPRLYLKYQVTGGDQRQISGAREN
jgi:hypothetical protein